MSLDVDLIENLIEATNTEPNKIVVHENGRNKTISREEWDARYPNREPMIATLCENHCFSSNITHNLREMASAAGLYEYLWRPEEIGITHANMLIRPLVDGLERLRNDPDTFRALNPENGWGSYETLVEFVKEYLVACIQHPTATVNASR